MYGREIEALLSKFKSHGNFMGIFARGEKPHFKVGSVAIFNTLTQASPESTKEGEQTSEERQNQTGHWLCISRPSHRLFEIFDAEPRRTGSFTYLFDGYTGSLVLNTVDLMPPGSKMCGQFAVYFVVIRLSNIDIDFTTLINMYLSLDLISNTHRVRQLLRELETE